MIDTEALRERWIGERPTYAAFAAHIRGLVEQEARHRGILCSVTDRPKDVSQFLRKALRKQYANPYDEIRDKAGVRIVVVYPDSVPHAEDLVRSLFDLVHYENKLVGLEHDKLGYLGIHFEVTLPERAISEGTRDFGGLICEVQLHTLAQNLWAEISHDLTYKPSQPPPLRIVRNIYLLASLVEIFDEQLSTARSELLNTPGFNEARILEDLLRNFHQFTGRGFDRDLSLAIIGELQQLLSREETQGFGSFIDHFVDANREKIEEIYRSYQDDTRVNPLLFQPETLLIFERISADPYRLKDIWRQHFPDTLLESLGAIWGTTV